MEKVAFGDAGLFADGVVALPAVAVQVPCGPTDIGIVALNGVPRGSWSTTMNIPLRGLRNCGNTCYLNRVAQVLIRTPAMLAWVMWHHANGCPQEETSCVFCALFLTYCQVLTGARSSVKPVLAERRHTVGEVFEGNQQHDVFEFLEQFFVLEDL